LIAVDVGGTELGAFMGYAALASALALFATALLAASRIPFVLAEDRLLPTALVRLHPRFRTPWVAILVCAVLYAILSYLFTFVRLIEINVTLYSAAVIIELVALVSLRRKEPDLLRPFRIPGGIAGVIVVAVLPILVVGVAVVASFREEGILGQLPVIVLLATGPIYYVIAQPWLKRDQSPR
jgi:amino acid transporter